jgi:hypothetical protein
VLRHRDRGSGVELCVACACACACRERQGAGREEIDDIGAHSPFIAMEKGSRKGVGKGGEGPTSTSPVGL